MPDRGENESSLVESKDNLQSETFIAFDHSSAEKILNVFVGREDIYSS